MPQALRGQLAWRARLAARLVLDDNIFPPLILVPGHSPSQEQKCLTLAKRARLSPISVSNFMTVVAARPLMRVTSTPAQLARV